MMSSSLMLSGLLLVGIFLISLILTGWIIKLAPRLGLVREPTSRCSHISPTPRGGGISFVIAFLVAICLWNGLGLISGNSSVVLFFGGLAIAGIGFCEDLYHLPVKSRLCGQFFVIAGSIYALAPLPSLELFEYRLESAWVLGAIAAIVMLWWLNLFNFMDGIDGLAITEAISLLVAASILIQLQVSSNSTGSPVEFSLMVVLAIALLGFIGANWAPAKVFMGDVGSTFLGYTLGLMALMTIISGTLSVWVWMILPAVFWIDATVTLIRRILRGDRWYQAHQSHAYQKVSRLLENSVKYSGSTSNGRHRAHRKVTSGILGINLFWLFPLATCALFWPEWGIALTAISWAPLVCCVCYLGAGKPEELEIHWQRSDKIGLFRKTWLRGLPGGRAIPKQPENINSGSTTIRTEH